MSANPKRRREANKHGHCRVFSKVSHCHRPPFAVFTMHARGNESIIYFTDLCKPIETYIYARKKHPFASYPAAKHPNAANLRLQTYDKKPVDCFNNTARSTTLALAIIFEIQVPSQKFPFLLKYTIPWLLVCELTITIRVCIMECTYGACTHWLL